MESRRRVRDRLFRGNGDLQIGGVRVRRGKSVDVLGDELDAIRIAELRGRYRDAARALARKAPVRIVAQFIDGHALWQRPREFRHIDVVRLVVDQDIRHGL